MSPQPLFEQVKQAVVASILGGEVAIGDVLAPVEEWARRTGSSTETVRRAMTELARAGVVERIRRRGTVVRRRPRLGQVCVVLGAEPHTNLLFQGAIAGALREAGYGVSILPVSGLAPADLPRVLADERAAGCDCLVILDSQADADPGLAGAIAAFPRSLAVLLNGESRLACVRPDAHSGARQVVEHLTALGHRRIAMWTSASDPRSIALTSYCRDLMRMVGGEVATLPPLGAGSDRDAALAALIADGVTAYWAIIDHEALLLVNACHRRGVRVPADFSVIGRNDTPWCAECDPPLTTVSLDPPAIAAAVVGLLGRLGDGTAKSDEQVLVPMRLVVRGSSGRR